MTNIDEILKTIENGKPYINEIGIWSLDSDGYHLHCHPFEVKFKDAASLREYMCFDGTGIRGVEEIAMASYIGKHGDTVWEVVYRAE